MTDGVNVPAVTVEQMREVDRLMIEEYGILLIQMMENAGRNLAILASQIAEGASGKRVLVLAGKGNNGGGGLVAARHLSNMGARARVILSAGAGELGEAPAHQASILAKMGLDLLSGPELDADQIAKQCQETDIILDALLGYSLVGAPREAAAALIREANDSGRPIVALDVPSGVSAADGRVYEPSMRATATLTLALPKTALETDEARARSGEIYLADISVPPDLYLRLGFEVPVLFADSSVITLAWTGSGWITKPSMKAPGV